MSGYMAYNPGGQITGSPTVPDATVSSKGLVQLGGDLAGTADGPTVISINGTEFPAGGALTTGNVAQVGDIDGVIYAPLNLAGGSDYVSGLLPTANQVVQSLSGDLSGTTSSAIVTKVHGTTVPAGGSLTTGQILRVSGASALTYGALDLANSSAVTGTLPASNLPTADSSNLGLVKITGDLGNTAASPTVVSLTGSGGIVTTTASIEHTGLENNSATVLTGELIRVKKTVSLIHGATGNFDTTIWQTPARFRMLGCFFRVASSITLGVLGAATLSLGTAAGGLQLLAAYVVLGTETTSTTPIGALTADLGTDLVVGGNFQKIYLSAQTISMRAAVSAGTITAGSVEVEIVGYQI